MPLLGQLHDVDCQRDKAGNRSLHFNQYCLFVLLFLFNPAVRSLRGIQQASQLKSVQRRLGRGQASLGSLSEAATIFDPERLLGIIDSLSTQIKPIRNDRGAERASSQTSTRDDLNPRLTLRVGGGSLRRGDGADDRQGDTEFRQPSQKKEESAAPSA